MLFADRVDAGRRLAEALRALAGEDVVVVGLPPGGVAVAFEVARALGAPLDVIVVPGADVPVHAEPGTGLAAERHVRITCADVIGLAEVSERALGGLDRSDRAELERQAGRFRGHREAVPLAGRTVVVVDEAITTGWSARAACRIVRAQRAARVVLAAPVGPRGIEQRMLPDTDEVVCLHRQDAFFTVDDCYAEPALSTDEEVAALLLRLSREAARGDDPATGGTPRPLASR